MSRPNNMVTSEQWAYIEGRMWADRNTGKRPTDQAAALSYARKAKLPSTSQERFCDGAYDATHQVRA